MAQGEAWALVALLELDFDQGGWANIQGAGGSKGGLMRLPRLGLDFRPRFPGAGSSVIPRDVR